MSLPVQFLVVLKSSSPTFCPMPLTRPRLVAQAPTLPPSQPRTLQQALPLLSPLTFQPALLLIPRVQPLPLELPLELPLALPR